MRSKGIAIITAAFTHTISVYCNPYLKLLHITTIKH